MGNIVIPKHTAETVYFDSAMQVLASNESWMLMQEFTDKLFALLVEIGKETKRSSDNTHYTKCAQLPMYFGLAERKVESGKTFLRINEKGREFLRASTEKNFDKIHELLIESIEAGNFGELNMGVPSSRSDVDPPALFIRASYDLQGLNNKEFAFLIWSLVDRNDDYTGSIKSIKEYRKKLNWDIPTSAQIYKDCKPIMILQRWGFLESVANGLGVSSSIDQKYRDRLLNLKIYSIDRNSSSFLASKVGFGGLSKLKPSLEFLSPYLAAIRTKPFILLAGISGTGKSRMVRQLARGCCPRFKSGTDEDHPLYDEQKPGNFEMIPVRPNWHDSTELMGYVSRISGSPKYVITDFIRFLAKAWLYEKEGIPFFLCLDEMNLAPVEQYFAEFLSVIETRKKGADGRIVTDTLVKINDNKLLEEMLNELYLDKAGEASDIISKFKEAGGIPIPSNLVVMGTVNMDETTCTFSRKVLDRAMSFELNDVSDMYDLSNIDGEGDYEFGSIDSAAAKQSLTTGKEACDTAKDICGKVLGYLKTVNEKLDKTAFKIAYRSRNEIMIYCLERINGDVVSLAEALDEATSMKILSRIEGDSQHVTEKWLGELSDIIADELAKVDGYDESKCNICRDKLNDMKGQVQSGYTSFWMR